MQHRGALRQELIIRKKVYRSLRSQFSFLKKNLKYLYDNPFLWSFTPYNKEQGQVHYRDITNFWDDMWVFEMIRKMTLNVKKSVVIGYKRWYNLHKQAMFDFWVSFDIQNPSTIQYVDNFLDLHLSDYKGSISLTTKNNVVGILKEGIRDRLSYADVAKKINTLDSTTFSMNRAKLIATREMWQAYAFGNYIPMKELTEAGAVVEKQRLTARDDRVTYECNYNETIGRVPFDYVYGYDNDDIAPRSNNPNCRCDQERRVVN